MALNSSVVKIMNNIRHASKKLTQPGAIMWHSTVENKPNSKLVPVPTLQFKLWNDLLGEKLSDFAGNIPYTVMRLTVLPIKAIDLTAEIHFDRQKIAVMETDSEKKFTEYNKIIPGCNPTCTPRAPASSSPCNPCKTKTDLFKVYPCWSKKPDPYKKYPGCAPRQKIYVLKRKLSTLNRSPYLPQDPHNPNIDPAFPQDDPCSPERNPPNPQRSPSQDPDNPDETNPSKKND